LAQQLNAPFTITIVTAEIEVGLNPHAGSVLLQHKIPSSGATFMNPGCGNDALADEALLTSQFLVNQLPSGNPVDSSQFGSRTQLERAPQEKSTTSEGLRSTLLQLQNLKIPLQ